MASALAQGEGSSRRTNPRLRGVEVIYTDGRPRRRMKLVIAVRGMEPVQHKVAETVPMSWSGNILCPTPPSLTVDVCEKRMPFLWKRRAHIEVIDIDSSSISIPCAGGATINLSFSGFHETEETEAERRKEDVKVAREKAEAKPVILEKMGKVRSLIGIIKSVGEAVSDIHPAIKGAFVAVGLLIEACETQEACKEAALALTKEWDEFLSISSRVGVLTEREESREAVKRMLELIDTVSNCIINETSTSIFGGLLSQEYKEKIEDFQQKFTKATKAFELSLQVEAVKGVHFLENNQILELLKPAHHAHYKPEEQCLKDTRTNLLGTSSMWLRRTETIPSLAQSRVFWVYGMGGSGKSYVANTVAAIVEADEHLDLSCFFCKRDDPDLSKPETFFRTLAFRIAQYHASYRSGLVALLRSPEGAAIATGGARTHFKKLFGDLLPKMKAPAHSHVIVIDALDECGTPADQGELAECILSLAEAAPWIRIFITSRPVEEIRRCFSSDSMCMAADIKDEADTDADIRCFIEVELEHLQAEQKMESTLSPAKIDELVRQAAGLFIWASTLFKYIAASGNPDDELDNFISGAATKEPLEQLYALYDRILESAVNAGHKKDADVLHAILRTVYATAGNRPLSLDALSCFLRVDEQYKSETRTSVRNRTRPLHAVLYEDAKMHSAVRVHHPSFLDFLEERVNDWFSLGIEDVHRVMFRSCLATMNAEFKFNICDLKDSTRLNKDVDDLPDRISKSISEALYYSSLFWFSHLSRSVLQHDDDAKSSVTALLCSQKSIFWLEVLSLLRAAGQGAAILRGCAQFFEGAPEIAGVASDLEKFVLSSSEAMESTPHLYLSALTWVPEKTPTQSRIAAQFKDLDWITRKEAKWEGTRWVKSVGERVDIVACSPNGRFIAAAVRDGTVRILDSGTGELVGKSLWFGESIESLSFSADGERITVVSGKTVTNWNAETGAAVGDALKLEGLGLSGISAAAISPDGSLIACGTYERGLKLFDAQTGATVEEQLVAGSAPFSVAFSPDKECVVSGSSNGTLSIWNVKTSASVGNPLNGHEDTVWSVGFSPDGRCIVSGSSDKTVRIWNAKTGAALFEPLRGHSHVVRTVAFSADGQWVVSGSHDCTIRIWEAKSGVPVGVPLQGHSNSVCSTVFSPDGRHIVSGSDDGTVRLWDVGFGAAADDASEGHSGMVNSVTFSPDGEHIASGSSDRTVRIWDRKTGVVVGGTLEDHEGWVNSVCFSPDGLLVASASDDQTIRIWNAVTGAAVGEPFVGHTDAVISIAFSPDGEHVVSGSTDKTIRIWDVKTGMAIGNPLGGHEGVVTSVSYSPEGRFIVSGSYDKTVRIWNAKTGAALFEPLRGHSNHVASVAFSPDGRLVSSGSWDGTIRIWTANTGAAIHGPLECFSPVHSVAFSPDSRRIVSGCDEDIRIWDVETRADIAEPLRGHSGIVTAVAFSPDGQRIVSGSHDHTICIWDARIAPPDREGNPLPGAHWDACCGRMDIEDGWVKDREKLLLWIPHRYRENFKYWRIQICIRRGAPWPVKPEVDLEKLSAYTGAGWTQIYEE